MAYSTVLPLFLSLGSTSAIPANYQAYMWFYLAYCLFLAHYCSSTSPSYFIMFPVRVDFPASTCPMKTMLIFSFLNWSILTYLSWGHWVVMRVWILISGSPFLMTTYSFFYTGAFLTSATGFSYWGLSVFFFFLSSLKS